LAFSRPRTDASWRSGCAAAHASRLNTASQITLRYQFQFNLSGTVQLIKYPGVGLTRERTDNFTNSTRFEQLSQTIITISGIVIDNNQVLDAQFDQTINQFSRLTCCTKATDHDG